MFSRRRNRLGYKAVISLLLCTALTLNTGCQNTNQAAKSPKKEVVQFASTQTTSQEVETPNAPREKPPQESNGFNDTLDGVGEFVEDAAKFTGQVALVGAVVVGSMFVNYQM